MQVLNLLIGVDRLPQLRKVKDSHQANQKYAADTQGSRTDAIEKWMQVTPPFSSQNWSCRDTLHRPIAYSRGRACPRPSSTPYPRPSNALCPSMHIFSVSKAIHL